LSVNFKQYNDVYRETELVQIDANNYVETRSRETMNAPQARSVVFQAGDTLQIIARRYNVRGGAAAIARANNITNPSRVTVGQRLVIP
jgi:LysM repeat protein